MPTVFESLMNRGMLAMEAGLPEDTIKISGVDYPGVFSELAIADAPELGGFMGDAVATFTVRKTAMAMPPKTGKSAVRKGRTYKVARVTSDTASHTLELEDLAK